MLITKRFTVALDQRNVTQTVNAVQGDTNTRAVELSLTSDGVAWLIPEGATAKVRYPGGEYDSMPDGNPAWSITENRVTVQITPVLTSRVGKTQFQVVLVLGDATISTSTLVLDVQANPTDVVSTTISMIRGTTHTINITLSDSQGNNKELSDYEVLRFGVKRSAQSKDCLIEKEITSLHYDNGVYVLILEPEDTEDLQIGSYVYDVGLQSGEDYYNVISLSKFEIEANVTNREGEE